MRSPDRIFNTATRLALTKECAYTKKLSVKETTKEGTQRRGGRGVSRARACGVNCSKVRKAGQGRLALAAQGQEKAVGGSEQSWTSGVPHGQDSRLTALRHSNRFLRSPLVIKAVGTQGWLRDCEGSVWLLQGATVEAGNTAAASGD